MGCNLGRAEIGLRWLSDQRLNLGWACWSGLGSSLDFETCKSGFAKKKKKTLHVGMKTHSTARFLTGSAVPPQLGLSIWP